MHVGDTEGCNVGADDGRNVGDLVGVDVVGDKVGDVVGADADGLRSGELVGLDVVGAFDGWDKNVGWFDGAVNVGD